MSLEDLLPVKTKLALSKFDKLIEELDEEERKAFFNHLESNYNQIVLESFNLYAASHRPRELSTPKCEKCNRPL